MGDSSVNIRDYVWSKDHESGFVLRTDLYRTIKEKFDCEEVEIPLPYCTIVYKKDL